MVVFIFNGVVRAWVCLFSTQTLAPFFTGVAPFSGATTGTGGRIRDVQCTGRGAHVVAGTAGYCFGNLHIPGPISFLSRHLCFQIPCPGRRRTLISLKSKVILGHYGMMGSRVIGFSSTMVMRTICRGELRSPFWLCRTTIYKLVSTHQESVVLGQTYDHHLLPNPVT